MSSNIELIYIAGCDRSGSTLLDRILDQLDGVISIGEVRHLFYGDMEWDHLCGCGSRFDKCFFWDDVLDEKIMNNSCKRNRLRDFNKVQKQIEYQDLKSFKCIRDKAKRFYNSIYEKNSKKIIVDSSKSPTHALILSTLENINLSVIHLIRDSRGVAYSWSKDKLKPEIKGSDVEYMDKHNVVMSSLLWNYAQKTANRLEKFANNYTEVKYEDLVEDVNNTVQQLQKSLNILDEINININKNIKINNNHTISGNPMRMKKEIHIKKDHGWKDKMSFLIRN